MKGQFNIKRLGLSFIKGILGQDYWIGIGCVVMAIFTIIFSIQHINYFHIDFGGHIASSTMFERYGFHGRNPNRFHGLINNLFYPPGEDIIVRIIRHISTMDHINAFMTYIALVIFGYWLGTYAIVRTIKNRIFGILLVIGLGMFFFLDKIDNISYFQGGGFMDLVFTGLTSESLGVVFLLLFLAEYLGLTPKARKLGLWAILSLLSHLVVGPVVFLLWGVYILYTWQRNHIIYFLLSIGITSFFWLPFAAYKSIGTSSLIIRDLPILLLVISIIGLGLSYHKKIIPAIGLFLTSTIIILPNYLSIFWLDLTGHSYPLPVFHYYRFASIALLCCIIGGIYIIDKLSVQFKNKYLHTLLGSLVISSLLLITAKHFGILGFTEIANLLGNRHNQTTEYQKINQLYPLINNGKKIFTIDMNRPIDFGLDSYFQYTTAGLPFVKGLFRESYRGNQLESSYIASLLAPRDIVLDYHYTNTWDQQEYNRLRDGFIQEYHIGWILVAPRDSIRYLNNQRNTMLFTTLSQGTYHNTFNSVTQIMIKGVPYTLYQINTNIPSDNSNFVKIFHKDSTIIPVDMTQQHFSQQILNTIKKESPPKEQKDFIFFDKKKLPDYTIFIGSGIIPYTSLGSTYMIDLGSSLKSVVISLPDLPGWNIASLEGQDITVADGIYEKIITGKGKITISYHRTGIMIISYLISLLSLLCYIYYGVIYTKNK